MSKSKILIGVALSFSVGVFLASRFIVDLLYVYWVCAVLIAVFALSFLGSASKLKIVRLAGLFLFFVFLGILRFNQSVGENEFQNFFESKVKWEGYITQDPDVRLDKQLITIQPNGFEQKILITTTKAQNFFYGDWVVLEGKLKEPKEFEDFDYPGYLERFGVYALVQYPKIIILKNNQGYWAKTYLLKIKHAFAKRLSEYLGEPENSLALGILIGARRGLPAETVENFNITGTTHIVAISGFNIAVIVTALSYLAWVAGRRASFWLATAIILGFVVIAGGSASVIRAAVMGFLLLMSFNIGRMYNVGPAMFFAGAAMLYVNPKILYWAVGFQLSFAATLGLVYFMPILDALTENWPKFLGLKNIFLGTLAATVSTLPLILWYFGRLSLVALLANALILPFVPFAMLFGFLSITPFLAPGFALIAHWLLAYILFVAAKLSRVPFASVEMKISSWMVVLMFGLLFALYLVLNRFVGKKRRFEILRNL